ncbi:hypothetical protein [Streptomyces sp. NPDC049915]|uniref:hypothetical protein n=1 Tax=Streptomyces sp. NPDC049915 TaxID=3155510 RepID=UPI00341469D5
MLADMCCGRPPRGWTEPRPATVFGLVLVRRGLVRGRVDGRERLLDPSSVYVERPGCEQQFSHPRGGDAYAEIVVSETALADLLGGDPSVPEGLVFSTPDLSVAHRQLFGHGRAEGMDGFEIAERITALAAQLLGRLAPERVESGRPGTAAARRRLVDQARRALNDDPLLSLAAAGRPVGRLPLRRGQADGARHPHRPARPGSRGARPAGHGTPQQPLHASVLTSTHPCCDEQRGR